MNGTPAADRDDVAVALAVMTACQAYVQQADVKVSILMAVQAGAVVGLMSAGKEGKFELTDPGTFVLGVFVVASMVAGFHLIRALRPRLGPDISPSLYGIMRIPEQPPMGAAAQLEEAWAMARTLAQLAQAKYEHVRRAIPWTAVTLAAGLIRVVLG